jgi:hypothetical protein
VDVTIHFKQYNLFKILLEAITESANLQVRLKLKDAFCYPRSPIGKYRKMMFILLCEALEPPSDSLGCPIIKRPGL